MTALGAMVLAGVLMIAGCGGDEDEASRSGTTVQSAPATTPPERATTTSVAPSDEPQPLPSSGDLEGTYVTKDLRPKLTFTVGQGWTVLFDDREDNVALGFDLPAQPTPSNVRALGFLRLTNTFDDPLLPFSVMASPTQRADHVVPVPDDVVAWLKAIPGAVVGDVTEMEVAGLPAQRFEVTFEQSAGDGSPGSCPPEFMEVGCVNLFSVEGGTAFVSAATGTPGVATVVRLPDGERLLASIDAPPDQLSAFTATVDEVLRTLEIE